jgi:hypothetical protein
MSSDQYEAILPIAVVDIFERAMSRYMESKGFERYSIGSRLGGRSSYEFIRDDTIICLDESAEGQSRVRVVVHSQTVPVEELVLDAITEGMADLMQTLSGSMSPTSELILASLIARLRDAFGPVLDDSRLIL